MPCLSKHTLHFEFKGFIFLMFADNLLQRKIGVNFVCLKLAILMTKQKRRITKILEPIIVDKIKVKID